MKRVILVAASFLTFVRTYPRHASLLWIAAWLPLILAGCGGGGGGGGGGGAPPALVDQVLDTIVERSQANAESFFVYRDADDGLNKGFPSGFFGAISKVHIDARCIFDRREGCRSDPSALDLERGTVMRVSLDPLATGEFAGLSFVEPEGAFRGVSGAGYDLTGATRVEFDVASLAGASVQFGVAGCVARFEHVGEGGNFEHRTIDLDSLRPPPGSSLACPPPDRSNVGVLFTVVSNDQNAAAGATIFLDNIRFTPTPARQMSTAGAVSFPVGTATFGAVATDAPPFPSDQVLRNLTTIYESAIALQALGIRGSSRDELSIRRIADAFDYALHHDNQGLPIPSAPDGSRGLHSGYSSGDLGLNNGQGGAVASGQVRLAGFSASLCAPSLFCLVLDGTTGGNNAFAIVALIAAYDRFGTARYLDDAIEIGRWIDGTLRDGSGAGFGGYFLGYPDGGAIRGVESKVRGKSVENNADLFRAFRTLAARDPTHADEWAARAKHAGDFVLAMFDANEGRFWAGTVPAGTGPSAGIAPDEERRRGDDVVNSFDFLDSQTFTTLALASSDEYRAAIDWRLPIRHAAERFATGAQVDGETFDGFNIVADHDTPDRGVAWEFTGQMVVAMRLVDRAFGAPDLADRAALVLDEIRRAHRSAPFGDGRGIVAATIDGSPPLPVDQCLETPFQCIPARVGLAASAWAVFAEADFNPLAPPD